MKSKLLSILSILLLICSIVNLFIYYTDVKKINELTKEKIKTEIEILKQSKAQ